MVGERCLENLSQLAAGPVGVAVVLLHVEGLLVDHHQLVLNQILR